MGVTRTPSPPVLRLSGRLGPEFVPGVLHRRLEVKGPSGPRSVLRVEVWVEVSSSTVDHGFITSPRPVVRGAKGG